MSDLAKRFVEIMAAHADDDGVPTIKYAALAEMLVAEVDRLSKPAPAQLDLERLVRRVSNASYACGEYDAGEHSIAGYEREAKKMDDALKACLAAVACTFAGSASAQDRATRMVWLGATSEEDACEAVAYACASVATDEDEPVECEDGEEVYEVELRARKVTAERVEKENGET